LNVSTGSIILSFNKTVEELENESRLSKYLEKMNGTFSSNG